jgi:hypothetical protein
LRAGPLSSPRVVDLLNRYFVPVYVSMEDFEEDGPAPAGEKAELRRIFREAGAAGMSVGTVHVYLLAPDGRPIDTLHVAQATRPGRLVEALERAIRTLHVNEGPPLIPPTAQSTPPDRAPDTLLLHLTARYLHRGGSWNEFPSENWIVLDRGMWSKLLPPDPGPVEVGRSWPIDPAVSARLLTYFYPQTENNDVATNRLDRHTLRATVVSTSDGVARVRIDGELRMKHPFYPHRDDDKFVEATILGALDFDIASRRLRSIRLATERATYGTQAFGVAVRSVP